jgi:hypothetical protein
VMGEGITLMAMSRTLTLPDATVEAVERAAAARGVSIEELLTEWTTAVDAAGPPPASTGAMVTGDEVWDAFIGGSESGDPEWAATDAKVLRRAASERRR